MSGSGAPDRLRVLFVLGAAHSGTTILARTLDQIDGVVTIGEAHAFWSRVTAGGDCGCGRPLADCPVWARATAHARAADAGGRPTDVDRWWREDVRNRYVLPHLVRPPRRGSGGARYVEALTTLYRHVVDATGARVVVDTGKSPAEAALLLHRADVDVRLLLVTRDPRGVAFSWTRRAARLGHAAAAHGPIGSTLNWLTVNLLSEALVARAGGRRLRYEDWAADPRHQLELLADWLGTGTSGLRFHGDDAIELAPTHTVAGNRWAAAERGPVRIHPDGQWVGGLAPHARRVVTGTALPLLLAYGYPVTRPGSDHASRGT